MPRTATAALENKTARLRLKPRKQPYFRSLRPGLTLGYARHAKGAGTWIVRELIDPSEHRFRQVALGTADDFDLDDGVAVLTYEQARDKAGLPVAGPLTVKEACKRYVARTRAHKGEAAGKAVEQQIAKHVDEHAIAGRRVADLTKSEIEAWLTGLAQDADPDDEDVFRRSRSTANRILTSLRAALNLAYQDDANNLPNDSAWRKVKPFRDVDGRRDDHFEADEVSKLIEEARKVDAAFADLVAVGFLTGCRLGELTACDVRHFRPKDHVLAVAGKTGARSVTLTGDCVQLLNRIVAGRARNTPLLPKADGARWQKSEQHRPMKAALAAAKLPASASFYALRHSHISRSIEAGVPLTVIAENCGTSLRMIEKNYAHVLAHARRSLLEKAAPALRIVA